MNELENLVQAIKSLSELDDEAFTDETIETMLDNVKQWFSPELVNQSVNQIVKNLEDQGLTKVEAEASIKALIQVLDEMIYGEVQLSGNKKVFVDNVVNETHQIFEKALNKYHSYAIELPIKLEEGAKIPTYAHDTDACADLYALEDVHINPETYGNKIRTGVSIQLPEGWVAMIFPRSSTGAKTTLRLSNSVGIIDSGYRGELGVLFDNTSVSTVDIKKGDRIAQLLVMPSYRFQAKIVDVLEDSDRGAGGFGSTGT